VFAEPATAPTDVRLSVVLQVVGAVVELNVVGATVVLSPFNTVAPVEVAVSEPKNRSLGAAANVVVPGTVLIDEDTVYESSVAKASPTTDTVPAVVESDFEPGNVPVPLATVTVN
jgi:hypothetical protein